MTAPTPYLHLPGTAREALSFYGEVFGGRVAAHSFAEFGRQDGPADAVAHGYLVDSGLERELRDAMGGLSYSGTSAIQRKLLLRAQG